MKIKEVTQPNPYVDRVLYGKRCSKTVKSTGTHYFDGNKHQCGRLARFRVNGKLFCTQHAGEKALQYLIKKGE